MAWRKWVVRSLVFTLTAGVAVAGWAYQHWTNPAVVRQQVVARLGEYLPGAVVSVESSRFRLLGGISVTDLRLARRDDQSDFASFPSGTIYPDKEQLAHGKLAIRKLEWERPRLHLVRRADGTWNFDHMLAPPDPAVPVPTIVFQNATILLEDRLAAASLPPLEIRQVNLSIVNDPLSTLLIEGTGVADLAGVVRIHGKWGRKSGELAFAVEVPNFAVGGPLIERLAAYCPQAATDARRLSGVGKVRADFNYQPEAERWGHEVHAELTHGKFAHAQLPLPLEDLEARVRCLDGQLTLESITARSGPTRLRLAHTTLTPAADTDLEGTLEVEHLTLTPDLLARLPDKLQEVRRDYNPNGTLSLSVEFHRRAGRWRTHFVGLPEDMTAVCAKFPCRVERVTGRIEVDIDRIDPTQPDRLTFKLTGYKGRQPLYLDGEIKGPSPMTVDFKVWGKDLPLDDQLRAGLLDPKYRQLVDDFSPSGRVDFEAYIRRGPGERKFNNRYVIHFHDAALRYGRFPYPMEDVTGTLDILRDHWECRDFHASHRGGEFFARAGSDPAAKGKITLQITGTNILLDDELEAALQQPALKSTWRKLAPTGRMSFKAGVGLIPKQDEPDIAVSIYPLGCCIRPEFFPYDLTDLKGTVHYHQGEVRLEKLSARHGPTVLSLEQGKVTLKPDGDVAVDLVDVIGNPIVPDNDLFRALPGAVGDTCAGLQLREPISLRTNMTLDVPADKARPPYIYWDGGLRLKDATLRAGVSMDRVSGLVFCRGTHHGRFGNVIGNFKLEQATVFGQPVRDIHSQILVNGERPDGLDLPNLKAHLYGGDIGGSIHLDFGPPLRYEVNLTGSQLKLEEFARSAQLGPDARLSGLASARLFVRGTGTDAAGLEGGGTIDVPSGKMYNLHGLVDLLKLLNLRWPDRTAFEEARVQFDIHGPRVQVNQLNLYGNAVSLSGTGSMGLDGKDLRLDFYSVPGRITQWTPPVVDKIPGLISQQILKIQVRGQIGQVKYTKEWVPPLAEPAKALLRRMSSRGTEPENNDPAPR